MKLVSPITLRLLAFNLLLVFLPAAGFLYLDTYERQMLAAQERSMVQQGRSLAAALSGQGETWSEQAAPLLKRLERRTEARLRVIARDGTLLADSSLLGPRAAGAAQTVESSLRDSPLYRAGALLIHLVPRRFRRPAPAGDDAAFYTTSNFLEGREVVAALAGRYGAATRLSAGGQRSVTLYSALPVRRGRDVVGVVLVSQSTFRILEALYEVRLGVFQIFLATVVVAVVLSLLVATTIARPLRRLARQAQEVVDRRGRLRGHFQGSKKRDEIGDLARVAREPDAPARGPHPVHRVVRLRRLARAQEPADRGPHGHRAALRGRHPGGARAVSRHRPARGGADGASALRRSARSA